MVILLKLGVVSAQFGLKTLLPQLVHVVLVLIGQMLEALLVALGQLIQIDSLQHLDELVPLLISWLGPTIYRVVAIVGIVTNGVLR